MRIKNKISFPIPPSNPDTESLASSASDDSTFFDEARLDGLNTTIAEPRTYAAEKDAIEPVKEDLNEPFEEDNCEVNVTDEMK